MRQLISKPFPYFVGIHSLEELITKDSKVCVINILGNESRKVTPVSHEYSGGNIVAGVQYGRNGELETKIGNIPYYPSVREVMDNGHEFDTGVIYLPPTAVSQAVSELVVYNKDLARIIIVTEKISVRDSRNIRYICQEAGVDVIGANCLGVANAWDHVRVGGALGGDNPEETLVQGSVAIHSNSGNFTTTMAEYLRTAGFGISTAVSSGKDFYIHFALPEFLYAAQNDPRTKVVALYVEPGGYYEKMALDWIKERKFGFNKPIVCCVTGRWKSNITRPCGHAGALAGGNDDALAKEKWFDDYFGVKCFDPKNPKVSKRGVRIASIQEFPEAMKAVFEKMDDEPDFLTQGDLSLKPWLSDNILELPKELDIPIAKALSPYDKLIEKTNKLVGAQYLRQNMRNKSGASKMNSKTQVSELHGKSILELSEYSLEENLYFSLAKVLPDKEDISSINLLLNLFLKIDQTNLTFLKKAKENNATPNAYLTSQVAAIGNNPMLQKTKVQIAFIIDLIREHGINDNTKKFSKEIDDYIIKNLLTKKKIKSHKNIETLIKEVKKSKKNCLAVKVSQHILAIAEKEKLNIKNEQEFLLATVALCIFWKPMLAKRISRMVVEDSISYFYVISQLFAYSVVNIDNKYWKQLVGEKVSNLNGSFSINAFKILFNRVPTDEELFEFKTLIGLTLTNGPGTISAKGAKESVSARNNISMAYVGFLANTGLAHGGNGFEAIEYLLNIFCDIDVANPGKKDKNIELQEIANKAAKEYAKLKSEAKELGKLNYKKIPCVNHPVFKGAAVNVDPREQYVSNILSKRKSYNVFLDFYHFLVKELFNEGATRNVFCVNVDAVLAVLTLKLVWNDYKAKKMTKQQIQDIVFTLFLYGRAIGVSAEISDHRDRGQDMDCRTPQKELSYVL
ncbi:MAG: CoA-binding protein [Ignavibacteriae bacterium]|nr:MAG: CoA-binding protein [Ignavibacteriota bacterium]